MTTLHFSDDKSRVEALGEICDLPIDQGYFYEVSYKRIKNTRTNKQNKAMRQYWINLGGKLNLHGLELHQVLTVPVEQPWNAPIVEHRLWRPVMLTQTGKTSTADLTTTELSEIYSIINRHISQNHGIYVPFPSYR